MNRLSFPIIQIFIPQIIAIIRRIKARNLADALKFLLLFIVLLTGDLKNHPK
jgi:hypothetical protein